MCAMGRNGKTTASIIVSAAASYLLPLLLTLSIYLLLYGHNEPGGGFVGGLVAAAAFVLYAIAHGVDRARQLLRIDPKLLMGIGLLAAFSSGALSFVRGKPFLSGLWMDAAISPELKLGTPLLFDMGIYLVMVGVALTMIFTLAED